MAEDQRAGCEQVNSDLTQLMAGKVVPIQSINVQRKEAMTFVPRTKQTMGYIVMTVVFNEQGHVLLVQEAKKDCRGTWYLPAGRLEQGENIVDGAKREILEEAGLECEINTMFSLHYPIGHWLRICFYGTVTGGQLKTLEQQDEESLQAAFYDLHTVFNRGISLRKTDILPVIRMAEEYRSSLSSGPLHPNLLPVISPHSLMIHRLTLLADLGETAGLHILVGTSGKPHLPTAAIAPSDNTLIPTCHAVLTEALDTKSFNIKTRFCGVLGVEHCGTTDQGSDGMVITTLVSLVLSGKPQGLPAVQSKSYSWTAVSDELCCAALRRALSGRLVKIV
ncbi:hypothetical protein ACOMHN_063128 [Nucella lapillus]